MLEYFQNRLVKPFHLKLLIVLFLQHAHCMSQSLVKSIQVSGIHPLVVASQIVGQ